MFPVQPQPDVLNSLKVIFIASPGSAPSIKIGPVTGFTRAKSRATKSATVESGFNCPAEESRVSISIVDPGERTILGGIV
ncbi:unannotated protein [freshwater metagenome]|uniref:Unannotated protein n=1 Tax=freshwater metagenome TaxID=449393 RepID=A0A6J6UMH7_9ZZZZ